MEKIDLNCDMGEWKAGQEKNFDAEIMPYISSCNIACGFHSGHPLLIEQTILSAIQYGVKIGAHPSYNDRENFGRISIEVDSATLLAELRYQIAAVKGMVESLGERLNHVKPHGALYNDLTKNKGLAHQFVRLVRSIDPDLKIVTLAQSQVVDICKMEDMACVNEGFADRVYQGVDQLRSRQLEGAVLHEPAAVFKQIGAFLKGEVVLHDHTVSKIYIDSLCLHSDTQGAVALSQLIHQFLTERNVAIAAV